MIQGIPYFGEETQEITERILKSKIEYTKEFNSLYDIINEHINKKIIVIIDNKWLSWLNDIIFNYRDKKCYIPYYTYELFKVQDKKYKSNNKGHLVIKDITLYLRYNYNYKKFDININNLSLILYDMQTNKKYKVNTTNWIAEKEFNIDKLYNLYVDGCYKEDDFIYNKHEGGYHYIYKSPKEFKNKEKTLREAYNLQAYHMDSKFEADYRDVRNFKYEEVIQKIGLRETIELYKVRRLKFESYLYCILRQNIKPSNIDSKFTEQWKKLGVTKDHIKYGQSGIKLIFKAYWLNNHKRLKRKSWSRI